MTRFMMEINGKLGDYWKASAEKEAQAAVEQAAKNATVEADGAIKWNSNDRYIPDDFCEKLEYAGFEFSREATRIKREKQEAESIAAYRRQQRDRKLNSEELAEMRAAFGEGAEVVDIITGQRFKV